MAKISLICFEGSPEDASAIKTGEHRWLDMWKFLEIMKAWQKGAHKHCIIHSVFAVINPDLTWMFGLPEW